MTGAVVIAVLAWAAIVGLLFLLPPGFAVATMFCGLVLFFVGAKLHWRWPVAVGGVLMFSGVFAAVLLGALG
ncbi:MAG: hypothetical protein WD229_00455 [Pirellulales bacterium]